MRRVLAAIALLAGATWAGEASAGPDTFTTGGPYGGFIFSMVKVAGLSPPTDDTVFAGTRFGVFKSTDGGTTWTAANNGLPLLPVLSLAVADPTGPIVYAGTLVGGIFKSVDGGGSWAPVNTGIPANPAIKALAAGPLGSNTVYASVESFGVYVTTNAGGVWSATAALPNTATTLVVSPIDAMTAYAGTQGSGVYKTTNTGVAWSPASTGLVDAVSGTVLYVGTASGVYRSGDSAGTWVPEAGSPVNNRTIHLEAPGDTSPWTIALGTDTGFYLGVDSSLTGTGATWTQMNGGGTNLLTNLFVTAMAANPIVYVGTQGSGVFLTQDGGSNWAEKNQGLGRTQVGAIVIDPTTPTTLYAGDNSGSGVYKSTDGGANWARVSGGSLTDPRVTRLAIDPLTPTALYAGTSFSGMFKSLDSGATWASISNGALTGLVSPGVKALAIDPTGAVLYAAVGNFIPTVDHVYVGNSGGNWVDNGAVQTPPDAVVSALVIDPTATNIIYAATNVGVFKSTTSASAGSWTPMNTGLTNTDVRALAIRPGTPSTLLAATAAGVFQSVNGGLNWTSVNTGLPVGLTTAVAYDPGNPTVAFAAVSTFGIYGSTDSGASWAAYNPGLAGLIGVLGVTTLVVDPILHAGTDGFGVFDASYTLQPLTVSTTGTGTGSVSALPGPIACGITCTAAQITGTSVTLTATPGPNSTFTGWSGGGCSGTGTCTVTMSGPVTVTATFTLNTLLLTVSKAGLGTGTVTDLTAAINCGGTCSAMFAFGTVVTLTATPDPGSAFAGWSGGGCSGTGTCAVTMAGPITVTATFVPIGAGPFTLTINKTGGATGTVTVTPPGFACDAACVGLGLRIAAGSVTLSATAAAGAQFDGWSGGGCAGTGPCTLVLIADTTVTAAFGIPGGFLTGTGPGGGGGPHLRLFTSGGTAVANVMAYAAAFTGGVFVAAGDLDGNGRSELITGAGPGGGPHVRVFNADGSDFGVSFMAYDPGLRSGSRVASCDVNGDGRAEIITGAAPGGGPHVRVFSLVGGVPVEIAGFFAFDPGFTGGVWVACGDIDGDGRGDIIVGADAGGGPHVRVFSLATGAPVELASFLALDPAFLGGVRVAAADVNGDGRADIIVGSGPGGPSVVRVFSGATLAPLLAFAPYPASFTGGVFVGGSPAGNQIITGPGSGWNPHVRVFTPALVEVASFFAYDPGFLGGVTVAVRP